MLSNSSKIVACLLVACGLGAMFLDGTINVSAHIVNAQAPTEWAKPNRMIRAFQGNATVALEVIAENITQEQADAIEASTRLFPQATAREQRQHLRKFYNSLGPGDGGLRATLKAKDDALKILQDAEESEN